MTDVSVNGIRLASDAPEVVVERLPLYVRVLAQFDATGAEMVSSEQLGSQLQMTPAQIAEAQYSIFHPPPLE